MRRLNVKRRFFCNGHGKAGPLSFLAPRAWSPISLSCGSSRKRSITVCTPVPLEGAVLSLLISVHKITSHSQVYTG